MFQSLNPLVWIRRQQLLKNINSTRQDISNGKRPLNEGIHGNMRKQGQVDLVRNSESETSGVEKSPTSQNKFNALLHVVNEEDSEKYDDNSMNWEFVDATQIIGDECDSFENSPDNNIKKNKKFLQDYWDALANNDMSLKILPMDLLGSHL